MVFFLCVHNALSSRLNSVAHCIRTNEFVGENGSSFARIVKYILIMHHPQRVKLG